MNLEIEGSVFKIMPEVTGEGRNGTWVKREFVIETADQYPKKVCFSTWGDKTHDLKNLKVGDVVSVSFNADSREYNERWYTDLRAWKIVKNAATGGGSAVEMPPISEDDIPPESNDDLPF